VGFLDNLRKVLTGGRTKGGTAGGGGTSSFGSSGGSSSATDKRSFWIYASCNRCGEPLKARIDTMNEPSEEDDGRWVVRKGLTGSGKNYCFQTTEVTVYFDPKKHHIVESQASGGKILNADEYREQLQAWERKAAAADEHAAEEATSSDAG
jgi:hypothetical protein